jgi:hypothetical protein
MLNKKDAFKLIGSLVAAVGAASLLLYVLNAYPVDLLNPLGGDYGSSPQSGAIANISTCTEVGTDAFAACYFNSIGFSTTPVLKRIDKAIDFSWGLNSPDPSVRADGFSVRWNGNFTFAAGTYTFTATVDDGVRVYVDGVAIIDHWGDHAVVTYTATKTLTSGVHRINVDYYDGSRNATAKVSWAPTTNTSATSTTTSTQPPATSTNPPAPVCVEGGICTAAQLIDNVYRAASAQTSGWNRLFTAMMLGPTYEALHPASLADDRPTNYMPDPKTPRSTAYIRIRPYEIGGPDYADSDYWSTSGQIGFVPNSASGTDPGLARFQAFAYYDHVFAESPRPDYASSKTPLIDPSTTWLSVPKPEVVANVRNYGFLQNEALVLYSNGLLSLAGTQTSRAWSKGETNIPKIYFPSTKVPTGLAVTTSNEFAFVTLWDTVARKGQLAVIALEGKYLAGHTMPYMGMINEGSWSDFKLLGYVDLPFAYPTSVAAASNGYWNGPSQTNNLDLGQIDIKNDKVRALLYDGAWKAMVAKSGYALVASKSEGKVAFVDLTPLFSYIRESYLSSSTTLATTLAARGPGDADFPKAFSVNPSIRPTIAATFSISNPTTVLAGQRAERWSHETNKGYVASEDGKISIFDTSFWMARPDVISDKKANPLSQLGTFMSCKNPTSMAFSRYGESFALPGQPTGSVAISHYNDTFYVACRGDREVDAFVVWGGTGYPYRRIRDTRMNDPVAVGVADRGYIVSIAGYKDGKVFSYRIGNLRSRDKLIVYGPGADGTADYELGGIMAVPGKPFNLSEANVN